MAKADGDLRAAADQVHALFRGEDTEEAEGGALLLARVLLEVHQFLTKK